MRDLTVLYDPGCELCRRSRAWLEREPSYIELRFLPCTGEEARERFGRLPWLGDQLVVVADDGRVWAGAAAFIVCLWSLRRWRAWSYRLSWPALAPLAARLLDWASHERKSIGRLLGHAPCGDQACDAQVRGALGPYRRSAL